VFDTSNSPDKTPPLADVLRYYDTLRTDPDRPDAPKSVRDQLPLGRDAVRGRFAAQPTLSRPVALKPPSSRPSARPIGLTLVGWPISCHFLAGPRVIGSDLLVCGVAETSTSVQSSAGCVAHTTHPAAIFIDQRGTLHGQRSRPGVERSSSSAQHLWSPIPADPGDEAAEAVRRGRLYFLPPLGDLPSRP